MGQLQALQAEMIKNRHSRILWVTFIAFAIAPLMGGVFMLIMNSAEAMDKASLLNAKVEAMGFEANWPSYLGILTQAMGVGGVLIFGFVASWLFGREYSDGTAKDLLALPVSRTRIMNAKFAVYAGWCLALAISNLLIGLGIGSILQLPGLASQEVLVVLQDYFLTTLLTILLGTPIALFALWGKGYLAPLGFVALTLVFSQVIAATGYGNYFPWSIPGLYSGAGGEYKELLNVGSYLILALTGIIGYTLSVAYWNYANQQQ